MERSFLLHGMVRTSLNIATLCRVCYRLIPQHSAFPDRPTGACESPVAFHPEQTENDEDQHNRHQPEPIPSSNAHPGAIGFHSCPTTRSTMLREIPLITLVIVILVSRVFSKPGSGDSLSRSTKSEKGMLVPLSTRDSSSGRRLLCNVMLVLCILQSFVLPKALAARKSSRT